MSRNKMKKLDGFLLWIKMLIIKMLYIWLIIKLLPERNLLWSYDKKIVLSNIIIELFPFVIGSIVYVKTFKSNNIYTFFSTIFFILFFIPVNSGLTISNNDLDYYFLINLFSIIMFILIGILVRKNKEGIDINKYSVGASLFKKRKYVWVIRIIMIIICILTLVYVYMYNGLDLSTIFSDMYSTRAAYADYAVKIQGTMISYLTLIITRISGWLLPIYLYYAILNRKIIDVCLCIFTFIATYSVEMQKTTLFIIFVVIFVLILYKKNKISKVSEIVMYGFIGLYLIAMIEYFLNGNSVIFTVFIRRVTYVPNYLTHIYYQFFKYNEKLWFTQDVFFIRAIMSKILVRPYVGSTVEVISKNCFGGRLASPNTGIFAEAYAQMGILGVFIFPFIYIIIIKKMKESSEIFGIGVSIIVLTKLCFSFLNGFMLTSSNLIGILMFIAIAYIIKIVLVKVKI